MNYDNPKIAEVAAVLKQRFDGLAVKSDILKSTELKALYADIPTLAPEERALFGQQINALKQELEALVAGAEEADEVIEPIDVTEPFDINSEANPALLSTELGGRHPLMTELDEILDIFYRMGFEAVESRQIDDDYHMFGSLNFPECHPARDDYDTFMT